MVLAAICKPAANDTETLTEVLTMPFFFSFRKRLLRRSETTGSASIPLSINARQYSSANELNDLKGQRSLRTKEKNRPSSLKQAR